MLLFASDYPNVMRALPIEAEIKKLSRQYLANVIYTLVGEKFQYWVDAKVEARNKKVKEEKNLMIEMDPEIAEVFR